MKKFFLGFIIIVMFVNAVSVFAENVENANFPIYINNEEVILQEQNKKVNGLYVLPIREVAKKLGYEVIWNSEENSVLIKEYENSDNKTGLFVSFVIGSDVVIYGDSTEELKIQYPTYRPITYLIDGVTYIGCGDFSKAFDLYFSKNAMAEKNEIHLYTQEFLRNIDSRNIRVSIENGSTTISINGKMINFVDKPFIDENGRTQVPVRELCEVLNKRVYWFENPQRIAISTVSADLDNTNGGGAGGDSIEFVIGENKYSKNGKEYPMDTVTRIINNCTYIPLRIAGEFLNYEVIWQEE